MTITGENSLKIDFQPTPFVFPTGADKFLISIGRPYRESDEYDWKMTEDGCCSTCDTHDRVAQTACDTFAGLARVGKPILRSNGIAEWTVLAAIVVQSNGTYPLRQFPLNVD